MKNIKLAFFDMEGTIFKKAVDPQKTIVPPSVWFVLAESLGPKALAEEKETQRKWKRREYSGYLEWMNETIKIHKKHGLSRKSFEKIVKKVEFHPGVEKTFKYLKHKKVKTVLVSGGFKFQADIALKKLGIDHSFIACEYFWDNKNNLSQWNLLPADSEGKKHFMKSMIKDYRLNTKECLFVGDGDNDIPLAKSVGVSISFNGSRKLEDVCTHKVVQEEGKEDFSVVLRLIS